jgi:hypothetical protein
MGTMSTTIAWRTRDELLVAAIKAVMEYEPGRSWPNVGDTIILHLYASSPILNSNGEPIGVCIRQRHIDEAKRQMGVAVVPQEPRPKPEPPEPPRPKTSSATDAGQPMECRTDHQTVRARGLRWCPECNEVL